MSQVHPKSCRVCLGEGFKPIFSSRGPDGMLAKNVLYDRLAEKLRFVSMLPVSVLSMAHPCPVVRIREDLHFGGIFSAHTLIIIIITKSI